MKNLIIAICFVALGAGFVSCKKYPEGPGISFRSAKQRITNTWKLESMNINGSELVNQPQYSTQKIFFLADGAYNHTYINPTNGIGSRIDGNWQLQQSNKQIAVSYKNQTTGLVESTVVYNILKLYENCCWLRSVDNSVEMHLIPQS